LPLNFHCHAHSSVNFLFGLLKNLQLLCHCQLTSSTTPQSDHNLAAESLFASRLFNL